MNQDVFAECPKIIISVMVNYVQYIGIIRAFHLSGGTCYVLQCLGDKKLQGCGLLGGLVPKLKLWTSDMKCVNVDFLHQHVVLATFNLVGFGICGSF